jgi:hypothetical protein
MCLRRIGILLCLWGVASCASASTSPPVTWSEAPGDEPGYPLDEESRKAPRQGKLDCPVVQLVDYAGDRVAYHKPVRTNPFFRERLQRFEEVVHEVAIEVYDRPPQSIRHFGVYNCRRVRGKAKFSEHAFGNAIDVGGFEFGPGDGPLRDGFRVSVLDHWDARTGEGRLHSRFLYRLADALSQRPDIFRGMLGPGAAGHDDHYHFDMGPYRYVTIGR